MTVPARPVAVTRILLGLAALLVTLESASILHHLADGRLAVPVAGPWPRPEQLGSAPLLVGLVAGLGLVVGLAPQWCAAAIVGSEVLLLLAD